MSDRLAVMNRGRVEQLGPPKTVYEEPQTTFVADFLGISNLLSGTPSGTIGELSRIKVGDFEVHAANGMPPTGAAIKLLIRPERVRLEPTDSAGVNRLPGMVERVVYRGSSNQVFVRLPSGDQVQALVQNAGDAREFASGDGVRVFLPAEALRVLADTGTAPIEDVEFEPTQQAGTQVTDQAAIGGET